jgi:glycosyltransferase involved in cell wall biosynthesis
MPKLTIGMATFDDFDGVYFTLQSLRFTNDCSDVEFVVIDNNPGGAHSKHLSNLLGMVHRKGNSGTKYIAFPEPIGTAAPRNEVFKQASGDYVLCMDSHILLRPGTIDRLIAFYGGHPLTQEGHLFCGPLLMDSFETVMTHFDDYWRSGMWGIWGTAWQCGCYKDGKVDEFEPLRFTPHINLAFPGQPKPAQNELKYYLLAPGMVPVSICPRCQKRLPDAAANDFVAKLNAGGYVRLGVEDGDAPFEIPGQGLGLFTCRKSDWLGFNEHFRHFGGEEMYIHEKYRQADRKTICLPWLKWIHRFARPNGIRFPISNYAKARNYVLGAQELDLPLEPIYNHFVEGNLIKQEEWDSLLEDPIKNITSDCQTCGGDLPKGLRNPSDDDLSSLTRLAFWAETTVRDLDKHVPMLRELATRCDHVTEFTKRRESSIALAAGTRLHVPPGQMVTYSTEKDQKVYSTLKKFLGDRLTLSFRESMDVDTIDETDLLFIDSQHTGQRMSRELAKFGPKVRKYIVLHDTNIYGIKGEDGLPGLLIALKNWMIDNPNWFQMYHTDEEYGLTVISTVKSERPLRPITKALPGWGPGTELKHILKTIGIMEKPNCDCNTKAFIMDTMGPAGCREKILEIVTWMESGQERWGWKEKLDAAKNAVKTGLAFRLNPLDPFTSLVEYAIKVAEEKESQWLSTNS